MNNHTTQQTFLKKLPGVDHILERVRQDPFYGDIPKSVIVSTIRVVIETLRSEILNGTEMIEANPFSDARVLAAVKDRVRREMIPNLRCAVNATGVVIHTNLGRSLLAHQAIENVADIAGKYSNLEFDLSKGYRGSRYSAVENLLCEISGAEAGIVVNNNAGAVLLCLETIASKKEVIVSRGELVEIGGSFRIPDVMAKSGAVLKEVGTTNRTHPKDYEGAIGNDTALLLKVHKSNYCVVGFTAEISLTELVAIGAMYHVPVMEDLGSGTFIDFSKYGLVKEPMVQDSVAAGADIITFSGDKLLGGPQAGIIIGKKEFIDKIKQNPVNRALRIDKMTLAALEATLRLYRDEKLAVASIPTLKMLTMPYAHIKKVVDRFGKLLQAIGNARLKIEYLDRPSQVGGGALPLLGLRSKCIGIKIDGMSANRIEKWMRRHHPPIIGRIEDDFFIMDPRTIQDNEFSTIENAFAGLLNPNAGFPDLSGRLVPS